MNKLLSAAIFFVGCLAGSFARADNLAYAGSSTGSFGVMDLNTGAFTSLGNSGQTLAGLAVAGGSIFATSYHASNGTLFSVNQANGALTNIGSAAGVTYDDFGSTTTGLYAVGTDGKLYSLNPVTGAATLIGATGIGFGSYRGLSTNLDGLYFSDGANLYILSTTTGAATLVGAYGGSAQMGVLLSEGGVLYGGDDINRTVDTININTGAASIGPSPSASFSGVFYGLAPYPVPGSTPIAATPEPGTLSLLGLGTSIFAMFRRRLR